MCLLRHLGAAEAKSVAEHGGGITSNEKKIARGMGRTRRRAAGLAS